MITSSYQAFNQDVNDLLKGVLSDSTYLENHLLEINSLLNGKASDFVRRTITRSNRRLSGIYFTDHKLAQQVSNLFHTLGESFIYCDPTCGAGDLLLACSENLPCGKNLSETLTIWGEKLYGCDIYPEFVNATKVRLMLSALLKTQDYDIKDIRALDKYFPNIVVNDGFEFLSKLPKTHQIRFVLNPPYFSLVPPFKSGWTKGKVSASALFVELCIANGKSGDQIVAILPDVLRSGTVYKNWRLWIKSRTNQYCLQKIGKFDKWTDVNVFIASLQIKKNIDTEELIDNIQAGMIADLISNETISDLFDVRCGLVVPGRDLDEGPAYDYIHTRNLPAWGEVKNFLERRGFYGTVFDPPFVAIRRTSRSSDYYRAVGTVINGSKPIAVENHLIVARPKDESLETCHKLLTSLRDVRTTTWLNERILCRHLTVSSVRELPIYF
ncbi:MAG: hypothetical protein KIH69_010625 [Anaerolineae bacterium]|nr:hypothetical protein [Anaerolineae bacterium]